MYEKKVDDKRAAEEILIEKATGKHNSLRETERAECVGTNKIRIIGDEYTPGILVSPQNQQDQRQSSL